MQIKDYIQNIKDFPQKGVIFKDITPLLNNAKAFQKAVDEMGAFVKSTHANVIVAPEARGFLLAAPLAYKLGIRLVIIRKPGKLPKKVYDVSYDLEYGQNHLQLHQGDIQPEDRVVIVDDVLATGGTLEAIEELVKMDGGKIVGVSVLIDLVALHEKNIFAPVPVNALVKY